MNKPELQTATVDNFNEIAYILANPDVGVAIMNGELMSAFQHLKEMGLKEGRSQLVAKHSQPALDSKFLAEDVPHSKLASHDNSPNLMKSLLKPGMSVLEVGSRCVASNSMLLRDACDALDIKYVGFDYYPGPNVDISGDAHRLSTYLDQQFDVIYSSAVFEHLAMPWIAAYEIQKCLKVGGHLLIETHFSFSSHERPWHFFQFSDMGLKALFSPAMGMECIEAGLYNPIVGRFSGLASSYLRYRTVNNLYCHSNFFGKKIREVKDFSWNQISLEEITNDTHYPKKHQGSLGRVIEVVFK